MEVMPNTWEVHAFGMSYAEPSRNGIYKSAEFQGRGTRIVNMGEMFGYEFISDQEMSRIFLNPKELSMTNLRDGDLLFGRRSVVPAGAGKCSLVVAPSEPLTFESSIIRVRLNHSVANPLFHYYFFGSSIGRQLMSNIIAGTNVKGIRGSELRELQIPLPSLQEQRTIATALLNIDELLSGLDRLIAKKRDLKQAAMQQLLTGQTRLPGFSGDWRVKRLGEIANIKTGSRNNEDKVLDGIYPFFVRSENVERINSFSHECEAILVPGEGQIGKIFHYINGRFDVHQRVYAITQFAENVSGQFVYRFMSQHFGSWAMQNTVKATVDSLRLPTFQTFVLQLPPTLAEQIAIAKALADFDSELTALEQRRMKASALKQGMMQELLTGRTRLV